MIVKPGDKVKGVVRLSNNLQGDFDGTVVRAHLNPQLDLMWVELKDYGKDTVCGANVWPAPRLFIPIRDVAYYGLVEEGPDLVVAAGPTKLVTK